MTTEMRFGIVGVNMGHAEDFARLLNRPRGSARGIPAATVSAIWGDDIGDGERTRADPDQVATRVPGPSGSEARRLAAEYGIPNVVDDPRQMVGLVDAVLLVDDTGHGASHRSLATPFIQAGVALFIDKPMALTLSDAVAMFDLATQHGSLLMSCSSLRFADGLAELRDVPAAELDTFYAVSDGPWFYYGVHLAEMLSAAGVGRAAAVRRIATTNRDLALVEYSSGATAVIELVRGTSVHSHRLDARGANMLRSVDIAPDAYDEIFSRELAAVANMLQTGSEPVNRSDTLDIIELLELGERSLASGRRESASDDARFALGSSGGARVVRQ